MVAVAAVPKPELHRYEYGEVPPTTVDVNEALDPLQNTTGVLDKLTVGLEAVTTEQVFEISLIHPDALFVT